MSAALRFSAIVLAAGVSSRMQGNTPKLLLPVAGEPAIRRTVRAVLQAQPLELVVVLGSQQDALRQALAGLPVGLQANPAFAQGQMSSVAAGARALTRETDAVMVCLGDMVLLTGADYQELVHAFARLTDRSILVPRYQGQRGNPVLIGRRHLPELALGQRNLGCRKLISDHPEEVYAYDALHDRYVADMDTPEDYAAIMRRLAAAAEPLQGSPI